MKQQIIIAALYLAGIFFSFHMLRIEHEAEKKTYTIGDRIMTWTLSLLSFLMVFIMLVRSWTGKIGATGYWDQPAKKEIKPEQKK